jgi:hypothetical protein
LVVDPLGRGDGNNVVLTTASEPVSGPWIPVPGLSALAGVPGALAVLLGARRRARGRIAWWPAHAGSRGRTG